MEGGGCHLLASGLVRRACRDYQNVGVLSPTSSPSPGSERKVTCRGSIVLFSVLGSTSLSPSSSGAGEGEQRGRRERKGSLTVPTVDGSRAEPGRGKVGS